MEKERTFQSILGICVIQTQNTWLNKRQRLNALHDRGMVKCSCRTWTWRLRRAQRNRNCLKYVSALVVVWWCSVLRNISRTWYNKAFHLLVCHRTGKTLCYNVWTIPWSIESFNISQYRILKTFDCVVCVWWGGRRRENRNGYISVDITCRGQRTATALSPQLPFYLERSL